MKVLLVGDAGCTTGFARVTHAIADQLHKRDCDVHILAINYLGDYHPIQKVAQLYSCHTRDFGDYYGYSRIVQLVNSLEPDIVLIINDPAIIAEYLPYLQYIREKQGNIKTRFIAYTPIDSKHIKPSYVNALNWIDQVISYTQFGKLEMIACGVHSKGNRINIIPHGVDTNIFYPLDKSEARKIFKNIPDDAFIVNVTDSNSPRKRIDLAMYCFSQWLKEKRYTNAYFYYHGSLHSSLGWDIGDLAQYFNISDRVMTTGKDIDPRYGVPENMLNHIYNAADIGLSCSMGEGWGLTVHERMACGIPMIVPSHSAFKEWTRLKIKDPETGKSFNWLGAHYVDVADEPHFSNNGLNTQLAIPKVKDIIAALDKLYTDKQYREKLGESGYHIVTADRYNWDNIGQQFYDTFVEVIGREIQHGTD